MVSLVAALVFFAAFLLAIGTMAGMFALYRDKMVAALLFEPLPQEPPVYRLSISRRRAQPQDCGTRPIRLNAFAA